MGIFAKEPVAGRVKTRLTPQFAAQQAALLYQVAQDETVGRMARGGWDIIIFYVGHQDYFVERFPGVPRFLQADGDLGSRMRHALERLLGLGYRQAALVGTDSPDLPLNQVEQAFAALRENDAVTVPAADGGYVLVGWSRPCPDLFDGVPWSTSGVLDATRANAARTGLAYAEIGGWEDFDDPAGLRRLVERSPASATAQAAARLLRTG